MEEIKKLYKPLVKTEDGRLVSIWAGAVSGVRLEYKEGEITYTPDGGAGIWVSKTLYEATFQAKGNGRTSQAETLGTLVVHEAIPLGERCGEFILASGNQSIFSGDLRYPAILLGKEVWREESKIIHSFKVGDRIKLKEGVSPKSGFGNYWKSQEDVGVIQSIVGEELRTRFPEMDYEYTCFASEMEFAPPEPKWVDVTKECEVRVKSSRGGYYLELSHQGQWLIEAGLQWSRKFSPTRDYKIEDAGESSTPGTFHCFKILKRRDGGKV